MACSCSAAWSHARSPAVSEHIKNVLEFADKGSLQLVLFITLINGIAEECFFRGALYSALGRHYPVLISTLLYIAATLASGNPMLGFAAVILGTVCALARRATGGVLAPDPDPFLVEPADGPGAAADFRPLTRAVIERLRVLTIYVRLAA